MFHVKVQRMLIQLTSNRFLLVSCCAGLTSRPRPPLCSSWISPQTREPLARPLPVQGRSDNLELLSSIKNQRAAVHSPLFDTVAYLGGVGALAHRHIQEKRRGFKLNVMHIFIEQFYKILVRVASACLIRHRLQKQGVASGVNYSGT